MVSPPTGASSLPSSSAPTSPQDPIIGSASPHMPDSFIPNPAITYPGQLSPDRAQAVPFTTTSDSYPLKRMRSSSPSSAPMQVHSPTPLHSVPLSHPSPIHHSTGVSSSSVGKIARVGSPLRFSSSVGGQQHPPLPRSGLGVESIPSGERTPMHEDDAVGDVFGGGGTLVVPVVVDEPAKKLNRDAKMEV